MPMSSLSLDEILYVTKKLLLIPIVLGCYWCIVRGKNAWFYAFLVILAGMLSHGYSYIDAAWAASV